jgi:predicted Zn-dependent protease
VSAASFRFRYLLGLLFHIGIGLFGCASNFTARASAARVLGDCGIAPSFADHTALKRWDAFPLDVHVDASSLPPEFRQTYLEGIERGVGLWSEATAGKIGAVRLRFDRADSPITISLSHEPLPEGATGSTELKFTGSRIVSATVTLTRSRFEGTAFLAQDVASTTAHEMGHALGIIDHSPHPGDKMWPSGNFGVHNEGRDPAYLITPRDVNTLEEAYCRP